MAMSAEANLGWLRFLYERKERLKLLVKCASSTRYADFHHELAEKMGEISYLSYYEARRRGMTERDLTREEIHVLTTGVWAMICEPFVHDFTWEQIVEHAHLMQDFMDWHRVLGIKKPD